MAHFYLTLEPTPDPEIIKDVTKWLISYLFPGKQNLRKWKSDNKTYILSYQPEGMPKVSTKPLNYRIISRHMSNNGHFDSEYFNLDHRLFQCFWLDFSIDFKHNFHKFDSPGSGALFITDGTPQQQYGEHYPIQPKLTREGHSFTSMQPQLLLRIIELRNRLVANSDKALEDTWFFDLRALICDAVSVIEITLNQIYIKAEYDPLPNWTFNPDELGPRHGRRFKDKIKWVRQITGNNLDVDKHLPGVDKLRELRNHMMHFDPPSLIVTIEESVNWINCLYDVGYLLVKIREALGYRVSVILMNFLLQKKVVFTPEPHFSNRLPFKDNEDYSSSTWPIT